MYGSPDWPWPLSSGNVAGDATLVSSVGVKFGSGFTSSGLLTSEAGVKRLVSSKQPLGYINAIRLTTNPSKLIMLSRIAPLLVALVSFSNAALVKRAVTPPPANGKFDYQIGGAYTPASNVAVVSRDRTDSPAAGKYNICYVNAFQTQPGEQSFWQCKPSALHRYPP